MFVIEGADNKIYRIYDTVGQCWKSSLIVKRRPPDMNFHAFRRQVLSGVAVGCSVFSVREYNGEADRDNYEAHKREWSKVMANAGRL